MKRKSKKTISQPEALFEIDAIRAKYNTLDELKAALKGAREFNDAFNRQWNSRRRENRRRFVVKLIGGTFALVGFWGSVFVFIGPFELIFNEWGLGHSLSAVIRFILAFGFPFLVWITFLWFSDKTGFHYLIEDSVVSWDTWDVQQTNNIQQFKTFPRRKRSGLIRDVKRELDVFSDIREALQMKKDFEQSPDFDKKLEEFPDLKKAFDELNAAFFPFGKQAGDTDDEELSCYDDEELPGSVEGSVERINRVIADLVEEADISSRRLISQPEHASWKGFVLTLEKTSTDLELELKDTAKYHKSIQPLLKLAFDITSKALYRIIDSGNDKEKTAMI